MNFYKDFSNNSNNSHGYFSYPNEQQRYSAIPIDYGLTRDGYSRLHLKFKI